MNSYKEHYDYWLNSPLIDEETKAELQKISEDEAELLERFHKDLEFGTGGLRGIMGAGRNRMNTYTIRKTTQGLANYILKTHKGELSVVISFDPRHNSKEFATETALVFNANGIKAYLYKEMRPTPQLSFSVRHLNCVAGVMVTASHNPPEYNGYKVYGSDGAQVTFPEDEEIISHVQALTSFEEIKTMPKADAVAKGLYVELDHNIDEEFLQNCLTQSINPDIIKQNPIKIVYTPLHGAGNIPVRTLLKTAGFEQVYAVEEQTVPDGNFTTVVSPNPEEASAFELAIKKAKEIDAHIAIATDPDSDRVGVVTKDHSGEYTLISGNTLGVLLVEYILSQRKLKGMLPNNPAVISTIVSTNMAKDIAESVDIDYFEVLTGFKHFGRLIRNFEEKGSHTFVCGFEESFGYSAGTYQRDKDAVGTALVVSEMTAYYTSKNMTLYDAINELYKKYGYFKEVSHSIVLKGIEGSAKIQAAMVHLTNHCPTSINNTAVVEYRNYNTSETKDLQTGTTKKISLPQSNVLYYVLEDESWFCVRPSGTEPKLKIYVGVKKDTAKDAEQSSKLIMEDILNLLNI